MDERILTMAKTIKEQWPTLFDASSQHLAKHLHEAGYRLDPYPNGKSKGELIARIETVEAERDKTRNLLTVEHERVMKSENVTAGGWEDIRNAHSKNNPTCPVCTFLAETSTVKP